MLIQKQSQVSIEDAKQSSINPYANTPTPLPDDQNQKKLINEIYNQEKPQFDDVTKPSIQPLIIQSQVELIMTQEQKRNLIIRINGLWILQKLLQVALCFISGFFIDYDNLFYDYQTHQYRITIPIIAIIIFSLLLIVRFVPFLRRIQVIQKIVWSVYLVFYSIMISSLISQGYEKSSYPMNFFIFGLICCLGSIGELIILIQFHFQIQTYKEEQFRLTSIIWFQLVFLKSIFQGPLISFLVVFVLFGNYALGFTLMFEIAWVSLFTTLYIFSLLQIYKGKFNLREDEHYIGSVLVYINMFLPCI